MNRRLRAATAAIALACLLPACGSSDEGAQVGAGPNRSMQRYKHLLGKDGKPFWKPGMPKRMPTGMPKNKPTGTPRP